MNTFSVAFFKVGKAVLTAVSGCHSFASVDWMDRKIFVTFVKNRRYFDF